MNINDLDKVKQLVESYKRLKRTLEVLEKGPDFYRIESVKKNCYENITGFGSSDIKLSQEMTDLITTILSSQGDKILTEMEKQLYELGVDCYGTEERK